MNRLKDSSSPYLLQHKDNPVHWQPWDLSALDQARALDKPILVSIGYATCHWCHVMEHESFEDPEIADLMNEQFVCIKVDREERPDIDHIYMKACQILNGNGGWPLNCFLLPDTKPFFAGTYFPPEYKYGKVSWKQVLLRLSTAYRDHREQVQTQAEKLLEIIQNEQDVNIDASFEKYMNPTDSIFNRTIDVIASDFDQRFGGFGHQNKFPQTFRLTFFLNWGLTMKDHSIIEKVGMTLENMLAGGIFDHLRGGFSRYTVDNEWKIPHFEKMLYDNAFMLEILTKYYSITKELWVKNVILLQIDFCLNHFRSPNGNFYSAFDADSEGLEGKYYLWKLNEIGLEQSELDLIRSFFYLTDEGNFEHSNILYFKNIDKMKEGYNLLSDDSKNLRLALNKLSQLAKQRVTPSIDHKSIASWTFFMGSALIHVRRALGEIGLDAPIHEIFHSASELFIEDKTIVHINTVGLKSNQGFCEDYASYLNFLIEYYVLYQDSHVLDQIEAWVKNTKLYFFDPKVGLFRTNRLDERNGLIHNPIETEDYATPSCNALMLEVYYKLSLLIGSTFGQDFESLLSALSDAIEKFPQAHTYALNIVFKYYQSNEIIKVDGQNAKNDAIQIAMKIPEVLIRSDETKKSDHFQENSLIFHCKNFVCESPTNDVNDFIDKY